MWLLKEDFPVIANKQRLNKHVLRQNITAAVKQSCSEDAALRSADNSLLKEAEKLQMEIPELKADLGRPALFLGKAAENPEMHSVVQELRGAVGDIKALLSDGQQKSDKQSSNSRPCNSSVHDTSASRQLGDGTAQGCGLEMNYICLGQVVNIKKAL
ncbi:hypothetical protein AOLI_G00291220 [Acnodon oligacanthus]